MTFFMDFHLQGHEVVFACKISQQTELGILQNVILGL